MSDSAPCVIRAPMSAFERGANRLPIELNNDRRRLVMRKCRRPVDAIEILVYALDFRDYPLVRQVVEIGVSARQQVHAEAIRLPNLLFPLTADEELECSQWMDGVYSEIAPWPATEHDMEARP